MIVYIVTVILTAALCCLSRDPARGPSIPRPKERHRETEEDRKKQTDTESEKQRNKEQYKEIMHIRSVQRGSNEKQGDGQIDEQRK